MIKKGEMVTMHNCVGAINYPNRIWKVEVNEHTDNYGQQVVGLEDDEGRSFPVKFLNKYRAVYKLNDYEWYITSWSLKDTLDWYNKEFEDELTGDDIEECNLDLEGMWWETKDKNDIELLGDSDELIHIEKIDNETMKKVQFGDLMRHDGLICKYTSFREVIKNNYLDEPLNEPEVIASIEW